MTKDRGANILETYRQSRCGDKIYRHQNDRIFIEVEGITEYDENVFMLFNKIELIRMIDFAIAVGLITEEDIV